MVSLAFVRGRISESPIIFRSSFNLLLLTADLAMKCIEILTKLSFAFFDSKHYKANGHFKKIQKLLAAILRILVFVLFSKNKFVFFYFQLLGSDIGILLPQKS